MSAPNLHVALALALGRPTQWSDLQLIADVEARCQPSTANPAGPRAGVSGAAAYEDVPLFEIEGKAMTA